MSSTTLVRDQQVADMDRIELSNFMRRVVSEPDFRSLFESDPAEAVRISGVSLSPAVEDTLIRNSTVGVELTNNMDTMEAASFFYFFFALSYNDEQTNARSPQQVNA
jgi:hypothetical protein